MRAGRRSIPQINSSSSADIAFLLLIFFLITSSMEPKTGIYRRMTPLEAEEALKERKDITDRNLLTLIVDSGNRILSKDTPIDLRDLKTLSKTFIANPNNLDYLPEKEATEIDEIGTYPTTSLHVIQLEVDRRASYDIYIKVLNEITAAYNELRMEVSRELFGKDSDELTKEQQEAVRNIYPMRLSEIEIASAAEAGEEKL